MKKYVTRFLLLVFFTVVSVTCNTALTNISDTQVCNLDPARCVVCYLMIGLIAMMSTVLGLAVGISIIRSALDG
jgi:hypothetical protein